MSNDSTRNLIGLDRAPWSAPMFEPLDMDLASVAATSSGGFTDGNTGAGPKKSVIFVS